MRCMLSAVAGAGLLLALAACGQNNGESAAAPAGSASSAEASAEVQPQIMVGQIESATATSLTFTSQGTTETVDLTPKTVIMIAHAGTLADIKPGSFLGTTNVPDADGVGSSTEVHIFPPGIEMGEGDRPMPAAPGSDTASRMTNGTVSSATDVSRMTNGAVGAVSGGAGGIEMDVAYEGGKRHIVVSPKTPIQVMSLGSPELLKQGTTMVVGVVPGDKESKTATFVNVQS